MEATTGGDAASRLTVLAVAGAAVAAIAAAVLIAAIGGSTTATAVTPADPVIYAAGDIACEPGSAMTSTKCREMRTSDIIVNGGASKALALGDLQYNSASIANLRHSYDKSWGRVKSITTPVIGNHESTANGYFDYFYGSGVNNGPFGQRGKGYYSYNLGSWHLIGLNSNCSRVPCNAGSAQEQWLRADLAANPRACTLAFWHHPRFSSGHDGDGTFMKDIWKALYNARRRRRAGRSQPQLRALRSDGRKRQARPHEGDSRVRRGDRRRVLHRDQQPQAQQRGAPEQHLRRAEADAPPNELRLQVRPGGRQDVHRRRHRLLPLHGPADRSVVAA